MKYVDYLLETENVFPFNHLTKPFITPIAVKTNTNENLEKIRIDFIKTRTSNKLYFIKNIDRIKKRNIRLKEVL